MKIIKGGVTAAEGFQAAAAAAGIKYQGRSDMAMVYSEKPCKAAGTFTTNVVKAAPVKSRSGDRISSAKGPGNRMQQRNCQRMYRRRRTWLLQRDGRSCRKDSWHSCGKRSCSVNRRDWYAASDSEAY